MASLRDMWDSAMNPGQRSVGKSKQELEESNREEALLKGVRFDAMLLVLGEHLGFDDDDMKFAFTWKAHPEFRALSEVWMSEIVKLDHLYKEVENKARELTGLSIEVAVIPTIFPKHDIAKQSSEPSSEPEPAAAGAESQARPKRGNKPRM